MITAVDIGLYTALTAFIAYETNEEIKDVFSSKDKDHPNSESFGDGCGKFVHWNKYEPGDTFEKIITKSKKLNSDQLELPIWRRSLLVAFLVTILITIVVHKKLISFPEFGAYFLLIFFMFYYSFNYYAYHYAKPLSKVQNDNLQKLQNKYSVLKKAILRKQKQKKNEPENSQDYTPSLV